MASSASRLLRSYRRYPLRQGARSLASWTGAGLAVTLQGVCLNASLKGTSALKSSNRLALEDPRPSTCPSIRGGENDLGNARKEPFREDASLVYKLDQERESLARQQVRCLVDTPVKSVP